MGVGHCQIFQITNFLKFVLLGDSGLEQNVVVFGFDGKKYPMDPEEFDGELDENLEGFMKKISSGTSHDDFGNNFGLQSIVIHFEYYWRLPSQYDTLIRNRGY